MLGWLIEICILPMNDVNKVAVSIKKIVEDNFDKQVDFLKTLVKTESENPGIEASKKVSVEVEMAKILRGALRDRGVRTRYLRLRPGRPNITGVYGPMRARKSVAFVGHMDTAGLKTKPAVSDGVVRGGKMYGRGVLDMKASLAAYIFALEAINKSGIKLEGKIKFAFVADGKAEVPSRFGMSYVLSKGFKAKTAFLSKPGTDKIAIGHRGGYRFCLTTFGEAVNTGRKDWEKGKRGRNAIADMGRVMQALSHFELPFKLARAFPGRQPVFTFPVKIMGGDAIDMVPDVCRAWGDVRLMPGNTDKQVKMWIQDRLGTLPGLKYEMSDILFVPSVEIDKNEPMVVAMAKNAKRVLQKPIKVEGCGPWNDAWMLSTKDIPCIAGFGPDGGDGDDGEWVDLDSLKKVTEVFAMSTIDYLGYKE